MHFFKGLMPGCLEQAYHSYNVMGLALFSGVTVDLTKTFTNSNMIAFARYKLNSIMKPPGN
jgi:hypothetical protein